jgi:hypothetical protein
MYRDIDEARQHQACLREIVDQHGGTAADYRALRRLLDLCRQAAASVDDPYCRGKLRLIEDFAAELFSHGEHHRWDRESMPGAQFLKQQILNALELLGSRLYSLEALRRSAGRAHFGAQSGPQFDPRSLHSH